jgi:dipeptidyl aminopeptidase/acylaminoacyl peptidase
MHLDGTNLVQLTTYRYNADPVLSPDHQRVAYRSVPRSIASLADPGQRLNQGYFNIWVITVDGEQAWQLTDSEVQRSVPVWSPDSSKVAFTAGPDGLLVEVEVDTQTRREIVWGASAPSYRPDGGGIGYVTARGGLVWIDTAGVTHTIVSGEALAARTAVVDFDWLPDGAHAIYTLADRTEQVDPQLRIGIKNSIWIAGADSRNPVKIADGVHDGRVSPDGKSVAALAGSGYGDACFVDQRLVFLLLAPDLTSAQRVDVDGFEEYPQARGDGTFYPSSNVTWVSSRLALGEFSTTCLAVPGAAGRYVIDPIGGHMLQITRSIPAE